MSHKPTEGVIAVDNGGFSTGIWTARGFGAIPSAKGEYRERRLDSIHGKYDFVVELNGKKYMCGTLAIECEFPLQMHTDTKQHIFFDLSILLACHQFGYDCNFLVTSVPIYMNNDDEKLGIKKRLIGEWTLSVNDVKKTFTIADARIAPETVTAFWVTEPQGLVRWVDWGSRTIGYGTTMNDGENMRYLDAQSGTFSGKGLEAIISKDFGALVDYVGGRLAAIWKPTDKVIHIGGGAKNDQIISNFKKFFPNSEVHENPQIALAQGMYNVGRSVYGRA